LGWADQPCAGPFRRQRHCARRRFGLERFDHGLDYAVQETHLGVGQSQKLVGRERAVLFGRCLFSFWRYVSG
jgi:hypothetical protein